MDTEKLIGMVRDRRALWDASDRNYQMRDVQKRLWDEIAEAMGSDVETARSKWRNLRDTFRRRHKEVTSGKPSADGSPTDGCTWSYYKTLLFLADSAKEPRPARRTPFKRPPHRPDASRPAPDNNSSSGSNSPDEPPRPDALRYDSDYNFLMSLYPYLKETPQERKLYVRTQMQQVLMQEQELRDRSPMSPKDSAQYPGGGDQQHPMMQRHYSGHPEAKSAAEPTSQALVNQQRMSMHPFY